MRLKEANAPFSAESVNRWVNRATSEDANVSPNYREPLAIAAGYSDWAAFDSAWRVIRMPLFEKRKGPASKPLDENVTPYSERAVPDDVPTFDLGVAAGGWVDVNDNEDGAGARVTPAQRARGLFDVFVRGDSMEPRVRDGAKVRFRLLELPNSTSPACDDIVIGKFYYVQLDDGRATFKRATACADGVLTLEAVNRKYRKPLTVKLASIARLAIALQVIDDL